MRKISLLLFASAVAFAQPVTRPVMSGTCTLKSGLGIRYKSVITSTSGRPSGFGEGSMLCEGNTVHRLMTNRLTTTYFGYDLSIGPGDSADNHLATFQTLTRVETLLKMHGGELMKLSPPPGFPAPQTVHVGDTIELDLMVSPDGTQKLTDYIEIHGREVEPSTAKTTSEPRDFTLDDGPVTFDLSLLTILKNGQQSKGYRSTGKPGSTFWIAFPGDGRYIISLTPHDGFTKSGVIRDNVVFFHDYEIRFMTPIAGAGKAWNLYTFHDSAYPASSQVSLGTDRLESLLPK